MPQVKMEPDGNDLDGASSAWKYYCLAVMADPEYDPTAFRQEDEGELKKTVKDWLSVTQMEPRMIYQHKDTGRLMELRPYLFGSRQELGENLLDMVNNIPRSPFIQRPIGFLEQWPRKLYNTLKYRVREDTSLAFYVRNAGNTNIPAALVWRLLFDILHAATLMRDTKTFGPGLSPLDIHVVKDDGTFQDGTDILPHAMLTGLSMKIGGTELVEQQLWESVVVLLRYIQSWVIDRAIDECLQRYPTEDEDSLAHYYSLSPDQKLSVNGIGSAIYDEELVDLLQSCTETSDRLTGGWTAKRTRIMEALPKMRRWEGDSLKKLREIPTWVMENVDQTARVRGFHALVAHIEHHEQPQVGRSYPDKMMDSCEDYVAAGLEHFWVAELGSTASLFMGRKSL